MNASDFRHVIDETKQARVQFEKRDDRRNELLEQILEELKAIRKDQEIMKEAMLYAPDGPGAEKACRSFHMALASEDEDEREHWMSRGR